MRKLIETKLANARNDLENVYELQRKIEYERSIHLWSEKEYEEQMIRLSSEEEQLNGTIETYENLLNCNELALLEQKAEAYDNIIDEQGCRVKIVYDDNDDVDFYPDGFFDALDENIAKIGKYIWKIVEERELKAKAFDELIEHKLTIYRLPNGATIIGFDYTPDVEKMKNEMAREVVDNLMKALGEKNE